MDAAPAPGARSASEGLAARGSRPTGRPRPHLVRGRAPPRLRRLPWSAAVPRPPGRCLPHPPAVDGARPTTTMTRMTARLATAGARAGGRVWCLPRPCPWPATAWWWPRPTTGGTGVVGVATRAAAPRPIRRPSPRRRGFGRRVALRSPRCLPPACRPTSDLRWPRPPPLPAPHPVRARAPPSRSRAHGARGRPPLPPGRQREEPEA